MPKHKVLFAVPAFRGWIHTGVMKWVIDTCITAKLDPRIEQSDWTTVDTTPCPVARNALANLAISEGYDFLCMCDNDMVPDVDASAPKFWDTSFDFILKHQDQPCVVGAPYCMGPPEEKVLVFKWDTTTGGEPNQGFTVEHYGRDEVIDKKGITPEAIVATGLILIDVRVFSMIAKPYFFYEYNEDESNKMSSEDAVFARDCNLKGIPQYCNWDCWAGHVKEKVVSKPTRLTFQQVAKRMRNDVLMDVKRMLMEASKNGNGKFDINSLLAAKQ